MQKQVKQSSRAIAEETGEAATDRCPQCGGAMAPTTQQVTAAFPSPALERFVCSETSCNYVKYAKLNDGELRAPDEVVAKKGETGAK